VAENSITIRGAREHNLKNIDVEIPRDKFVVITGISGSGKSSLAFDTIYAEGRRRYVESLSAYARQFLGQMQKPDVDYIEGLSPAISIDQRGGGRNPRSTVGTTTEVYDYLRLLYARVGIAHCPECGRVVARQTVQQIVDAVLALPHGSRILVLAPLIKDRKGEHRRIFDDIRRAGLVRVRVDGDVRDVGEEIELERYKRHTIEAVVDRLVVEVYEDRDTGLDTLRLADSVETALKLGGGVVKVVLEDDTEYLYSEHLACVYCGLSFPALEPRTFSFNSPHGACPTCTGLGALLEIDPDLVIPDRSLSLRAGALRASPWNLALNDSKESYTAQLLAAVAEHYGFSMDTPVSDLTPEQLEVVLFGSGSEVITVRYWNRYDRVRHYDTTYEGIVPNLRRRYHESKSDYIRQQIEYFMAKRPCPDCKGKRLKPESLAVTVAGRSIVDITAVSITDAREWVSTLLEKLSSRETIIARQVLKELRSRLKFMVDSSTNPVLACTSVTIVG